MYGLVDYWVVLPLVIIQHNYIQHMSDIRSVFLFKFKWKQ